MQKRKKSTGQRCGSALKAVCMPEGRSFRLTVFVAVNICWLVGSSCRGGPADILWSA